MNIKQIFESGWGLAILLPQGWEPTKGLVNHFIYINRQEKKKKKTQKKCLRQQEMFS